MKIEVEASALESIKAMCERLQAERDELLIRLTILLADSDSKSENGAGWTMAQYDARQIIAKCTQEQS